MDDTATNHASPRGCHSGAREGGAWAVLALMVFAALLLGGPSRAHLFVAPGEKGLSPPYDGMPAPWREYYAALGGVTVRGRPLLGALAPTLRWTHTLTPDDLQRGVAYQGSAPRLRVLLSDLAAGRRVALRVGVIGGSISWGAHVDARGEDDWFSLFTEWLADAFPGVNVSARNGAVPATPSGFMELCLEKHLGPDADLVFMEYATNDGADVADEVGRRTYERLARKVLSLPSSPALVLLHLPTKGQALSVGHPGKASFPHTVEDVYNAVAAYYQGSALSLRDATWHLGELHHRGANWSDFYGTQTHTRNREAPDFLHPSSPGHRAIADLAVWLLQRTLVGLALQPLRAWEREEAGRPLPVPMYPGNWQGPTRVCLNGGELEGVVVTKEGWELVNEGDATKPKWGYVATRPGARLALEINTTRVATSPRHPNATLWVLLAYLRSYERMGRARVACEAGCACAASIVEGLHASRTSTIFLHALAASQAPVCRLGVTVLNETGSGQHKFKVTGVMTSEGAAHMRTYLTAEDWLGHVNSGRRPPAAAAP